MWIIKKIQYLIWPVYCVGCQAYDVKICPECEVKLRYQIVPQITQKDDYEISVVVSGRYSDELRSVILKWKDHGRDDLGYIVRNAIKMVTVHWNSEFNCLKRMRIAVVPAPSSKQSIKKRGKWQTLTLAQSVTQALNELGCNAKVVPMLRQKRAKKQVKFDSAARGDNKKSVIYYHRMWFVKTLPKRNILIVDDICTTGATIYQCRKVLNQRNNNVVGLLALATT